MISAEWRFTTFYLPNTEIFNKYLLKKMDRKGWKYLLTTTASGPDFSWFCFCATWRACLWTRVSYWIKIFRERIFHVVPEIRNNLLAFRNLHRNFIVAASYGLELKGDISNIYCKHVSSITLCFFIFKFLLKAWYSH